MSFENPTRIRKIDLVVERQWHIGMHARALQQMGCLGKVYGGFPVSRYIRDGVDRQHLKTFPLPALINYVADKVKCPIAFKKNESDCLAKSVSKVRELSPFVACYATAYRTLFPLLERRGSILILERGSTHPENYFHQIEKAKQAAGLPWKKELPSIVCEEIEAGKKAHFIGAGSRMIAESYISRGYNPERILLVPWCTDELFFNYHDRQKRTEHHLTLVCVGIIGLRKGLGRLIRIAQWAEQKDIPLKIYLVGPLEAEAPKLLANAPDSIRWLGIHKGVNLKRILHQADLYILPSYEEGFGISILEAMSTGLPAVVSSETGGREAIRNGENGLILSGYEDETLDLELGPLLLNKVQRLDMGKAARLTVEKNYTYGHYQSGIAAEYKRMFEIVDKCGSKLNPALTRNDL